MKKKKGQKIMVIFMLLAVIAMYISALVFLHR